MLIMDTENQCRNNLQVVGFGVCLFYSYLWNSALLIPCMLPRGLHSPIYFFLNVLHVKNYVTFELLMSTSIAEITLQQNMSWELHSLAIQCVFNSRVGIHNSFFPQFLLTVLESKAEQIQIGLFSPVVKSRYLVNIKTPSHFCASFLCICRNDQLLSSDGIFLACFKFQQACVLY